MTQQHTPEPWHAVPGANLTLLAVGDAASITRERQLGGVLSAADARRIVACINACAGIPTEELEGASALSGRHRLEMLADSAAETAHQIATETQP